MSRANTPNGTRNGKRRSVYLDDATVEAARALGNGNIGEGIRRAVLALAASHARL